MKIPTQGLLADRNDDVFEVGWIVDEDYQLIGAIEVDIVGYVDGEASISSAVRIHFLTIDLTKVSV